MSKLSEPKQEHGTMRAYITGFILSLIFTFIPYYLVTQEIVTGSSLLVTILCFGILQMLVQVVFFLHLGRGPKPHWQVYFFIATVSAILVVVGGSLIITHNLHYNMSVSDQTKKLTNDEGIYQVNGAKTGACQGQHANHQVTIQGGKVRPLHTDAQLCDTLTFMNQDSEVRELTFGEHPAHKSYAGESEYIIRKFMNKTITLSELGSYRFHDHLQAETAGTFTVRK